MKGLRTSLKNYFLTGLLVILPVFVTVYIVLFLIRGMDAILRFIPARYLPETYLHYIPGLGLILAIILISAVGVLTRNFAGRRVVQFWEDMVDRIPLVRIIYSGVKQLLEAFFVQKTGAFRRVALLEYPRRGVYVIGFITGESRGEVQRKTNKTMINVFVPTTPNPTSGFYVLMPEDELVVLDMTVEDAFKLIISGGIFTPTEGSKIAKR
ncbi:MAG: DUF502 domain-containing protein [Deltaproteobacteria bacterium]|nr:MAG: DUF502 domain-containing protein [Deltaproteobacteria bacterium]